MTFDSRAWIARLLPQGPLDLARQLLLIGLSPVAYELARVRPGGAWRLAGIPT